MTRNPEAAKIPSLIQDLQKRLKEKNKKWTQEEIAKTLYKEENAKDTYIKRFINKKRVLNTVFRTEEICDLVKIFKDVIEPHEVTSLVVWSRVAEDLKILELLREIDKRYADDLESYTKEFEQFDKGRTPNRQQTNFFGRDEDLRRMKQRLGIHKKDEIQKKLIPIWGFPGVGKTSFLRQLLNDNDIRSSFDKRVYFISLGYEDDKLGRTKERLQQEGLQDLKRLLINSSDNEDELDEGDLNDNDLINNLIKVLSVRKALLIVDDPFSVDVLLPFIRIAEQSNCYLIIATRMKDIAQKIINDQLPPREEVFKLNVLKSQDALEMFKSLAPNMVKKYGENIEEPSNKVGRLLADLEYLPLGIRVAAPYLEEMLHRGLDTSEDMDSINKIVLEQIIPINEALELGSVPSVEEVIRRSTILLKKLDPESYRCFVTLGNPYIKQKPAKLLLDWIIDYWEEMPHPRRCLNTLIDKGIIDTVKDEDTVYYWIHAILKAHAHNLWNLNE